MQTIRLVFSLSLALIVCLAATPIAHAQEAAPPAYLSAVSGGATLERDGELEPAVVNMPLVEGDILRTASGRVEVVFPDGSAIDVDPDSEIEFLSATRVRVVRGAMEHRAAEPQATPSASADYLPQDLQGYGSTLDNSGSWQYQAPYGYVWYPSVAADWRPYYDGSWSAVPAYGWTWVGVDAWSWPTHHYGRWGYSRNAWFWIPGRTWSAAWVSWASASDYVSWCPLGFDGRPVFALSAGHHGGWNGWTVLSRGHFGARGVYTPNYSVDPRRIASETPFIEHSRAPMATARYARQSPVGGRQVAGGTRQSPGASRQPSAAGRQTVVVTPQSPGVARPTAVDRQQPILSPPGHAVPRIGNAPLPIGRGAATGAGPTNGQRSTTYERPSPERYRSPGTDSRVPAGDDGRRVQGTEPRYQVPRSEIPRSEAPPAIPPSPAQIVGGESAAHRNERARPAAGDQAPPAAQRPPPAGPRPPASGAAAPGHAAPIAPPAPAHAAPHSGGDSGHASRAPAGARGPR